MDHPPVFEFHLGYFCQFGPQVAVFDPCIFQKLCRSSQSFELVDAEPSQILGLAVEQGH